MTAENPQALAADPKVNAFVMANAGSGKTRTLVDRVARLLLTGSPPSAILCLTFTKAAAAEMQRRLYGRLGDWAVMADDDADPRRSLRAVLAELEGKSADDYEPGDLRQARSLFAKALETPGGLKIQTIHAFCEQLIRRFPLEAGVSTAFRVIDDIEAGQICKRAREAVALEAMNDSQSLLGEAYAALSERLAHDRFEDLFTRFEAERAALSAYVERAGGLAGLPSTIAAAVGLDRWRDADEIEAQAITPPALNLERWFKAAGDAARGNPKTDANLAAALQSTAEAIKAGELPVEAVHDIFFKKDGEPRTNGLGTQKVDQGCRDWLLEEQVRLGEAFEMARAARVALATVHVLTLAGVYAREYEAAKRVTGALDFSDLIGRARWLLRDGPGAGWVLYKLDGGVDHVLVDEAQDTSPDQWEIIDALTDEFFSGAGLRDPELERTVFVVGDEKQSIFSFQGAAPQLLLQKSRAYGERVKAAGRDFKPVPLTDSWRSTKAVLEVVDEVFKTPEMRAALTPGRGLTDGPDDAPEGEPGLEINHVPRRTDGLPGTIDIWPVEQDEPAEDRRAWDEPLDAAERTGAVRRLAERIAAEVVALVERGEAVHDPDTNAARAANWGDVLVLVRKRGPMFEEVLRALKRAGVPTAGADRLKLAEHPVFEDLLALGRAALFPEDDLNLAGVLRSPLCDLSEDQLFHLAQPRQGRLWQALTAATDPACVEAAGLVRWMRAGAKTHAPFDLYAGLMNRLDARGLSVRQRFLTRLGGEAADAMDAFLDQARGAEGRGITDLERFCAALEELDQTVKREMDEPRGEVRVMTAHSSKGLEAPIVILPDTIFNSPAGDGLLKTEDGGFLWSSSAETDCKASKAARDLRKAKAEEESLRLLYVGLTRARDRLILAGRLPSNRKEANVAAWWGPVRAAFERLGDPDQPISRYGDDPLIVAREAEAASERPALPGWLFEAAETEARAGLASPSRLDEQARAAVPSPLAEAGPGVLGRFRRGDLIHKLLERLPDVPVERRRAAAARLLAQEPGLDEAQRSEMIEAAFGVLDDERFAEVFGPGSRAEAAVVGSVPGLLGGKAISGRLDRLIVLPDRVLVVDFKTNRPAPKDIKDADPAYLTQMAIYWAVLKALYPEHRVEAALVWTDGPRLMPVPEAEIEAALASQR